MSDNDKPGVRRAYKADYAFWLKKDEWTAEEAAILLAGYEPEEFPYVGEKTDDPLGKIDATHRWIVEAIKSKQLSFRNSPDIWIAWFKPLSLEEFLDFPSELDAVLLSKTDQAPPAAPVVTAGASGGVVPTTVEPPPLTTSPKFSVNKAALIAQHKHEWPTIERDLQDASTNGLSQAAKAAARDWYEAEAVGWARSKNKLTQAGNKNDSLTIAMHTLPGQKHIMKG